VAVAAFMKDEIAFTAIVDTIEKVVDKLSVSAPSGIRDIADVSAIEKDARIYAKEVLKKG
jgi:1-deoxy-D-xylulose 5-phosphate reductoisomerase